MKRVSAILCSTALVGLLQARADDDKPAPKSAEVEKPAPAPARRVVRSEREWQKILSRSAFLVCRMKMTETAFTGKYWNHHEDGIYRCVACDAPLFSSAAKFDSGTGWPSFFQVMGSRAVHTEIDQSGPEPRVEVQCARCDSHLGHVFQDGPAPTGLRFCINSVALKFERVGEKKEKEADRKAEPAAEEKPPEPPPPGEKRLEFK